MKKHILFAAAVIAVSGLSYPTTAARADDASMSPTNETGSQSANEQVIKSVRRGLANVVDASTRHDGFKDVGGDLQRDRHADAIATPNGIGANDDTAGQNNPANNGDNLGTNNNNSAKNSGTNNAGNANPGSAGDVNNANANNGGGTNMNAANVENSDDTSTLSFQQHDDINKVVDQLHQDWKDKYGKDFNFSNEMQAQVFSDGYQISVGTLGDLARSAGERITADNTKPNANLSNTPKLINGKGGDVATNDPNFENSPASTINPNSPATGAARADQHLNGLQHYTTVTIAPYGSFPACTLLLTNRMDNADDWKIAVPRDLTEQQVHDALLKQLNNLDSEKATWPADETDGYKAVTREVFSAFSNVCCRNGSMNNSMSWIANNPGNNAAQNNGANANATNSMSGNTH
jgi:hypothetical protein